MKNQKGEILGVLQLINCKRNFETRLSSTEVVENEVVPFDQRVQELALSLASQAAVAYENNVLYENIQTLFEGFVKAAVTAIEQRDPTTSGHSFRVSKLTCGLAEAADKVTTGPYADLTFTREQMKEIRYAALLHDFGKVGVREQVLVKAKKLYPHQMELLQQRFDYIRKAIEADHLAKKLEAIHGRQPAEALEGLDLEYRRRLEELEDYLQFILQVNEPTVLPEGKFERLLDIAKQSYTDARGVERAYLTPEEIRFLSISKGSLDSEERLQIESHVIHTFNFLAQIPWTREIKNIPTIARAHHEKLDGTGYPYKLKEPQIPAQTKMMTISDIFDALSASDRPYKKAVPIEKALNILADDVKRGGLDPVLFQLFVDAKIYQLTAKSS
jgi:HD-GYP domain-containing protein (c-di-GMP phosphodiesterase class II)